jgi:hypothetical protein
MMLNADQRISPDAGLCQVVKPGVWLHLRFGLRYNVCARSGGFPPDVNSLPILAAGQR